MTLVDPVTPWHNWSRAESSTPAFRARPTSVDELQAVVGADLLVVGSRGHSQFTDALLGSVSQNCAHHASCPVVIIRGGQGDGRS